MTSDYYELTRRREAEVAAARQAIADGEAAVPAANAEVDRQRELLAEGRGSRGGVLKAQRAHSRLIESHEQAKANLRAIEKRVVAEQEEADRLERAERARAAAEAALAFGEVEARLTAWVARIQQEFSTFDAEMLRAGQAASASLAPRPAPSATGPGREFQAALWRLSRLYPQSR